MSTIFNVVCSIAILCFSPVLAQPTPITDSTVEAVVIEAPIKLFEPPKWTLFSCVETAKWILGKQGTSWGWAKNIPPTIGLEASPGVLMLTNEGGGHVAVVIAVRGDLIDIREGNWVPGHLTERTLLKTDPRIKGYWEPVINKL